MDRPRLLADAEREHAGLRRRRLVRGPHRGDEGVVRQRALPLGPGRARVLRAGGSDPSADITGWRNLLLTGEPYGAAGQAIVDQVTTHHSSYYIDDSTRPAALLISSGFTDDLFPADEAIRFYNRTRTEYPGADIAMFFGDFGHQRGQNKPDVTDLLTSRQLAWLDHYVAETGPEPRQGVEAMTETCPASAASGGPLTAKNWARMAKGEIRIARGAARTIAPDATSGGTFDPIAGGSACATADGADIPARRPTGSTPRRPAATR